MKLLETEVAFILGKISVNYITLYVFFCLDVALTILI